jgi:hypothetical protein
VNYYTPLGSTVREQLVRRILAHSLVDAHGCLLWQLSTKNGYGQLSVDGAMVYTHRLMYELLVGPIPPGLQVLHHCDVKPCNNFDHFFLGTQRDNVLDMWTKGRGVRPPVHAGETHHLVTLANAQVATILLRHSRGLGQRALSREYVCSQATIWRLVNRVTRRDVPEPEGMWKPPAQLSLLESA